MTSTGLRSQRVVTSQTESKGSLAVLLFAAEPLASEVAQFIGDALPSRITVTDNQMQCLEALRDQEFDLVLLEESLTALDLLAADVLYEAATSAIVVEVNFGTMQADRIVGVTHAALRRRKVDLRHAKVAARAELQHELIAPMTGLLLEAQLAARQVDPRLVPALDRLVGLAEHVCSLLRADDDRSL